MYAEGSTGRALLAGIVDSSLERCGSVLASMIFPQAEATFIPRPLGHVCGCALLRLADGTVWMLRLPGKAWTKNRILSAAEVLKTQSTVCQAGAEQRIRRLPGLEGTTVEVPSLEALNPAQWDIPRMAAALAARQRATSAIRHPLPAIKELTNSVEAALHRKLAIALREFVAGMDKMVVAAATSGGSLDIAVYNYLVREPFRAFRLQFAATFPGLVSVTVEAAPGTLGAELRAIVDEGRPVVKSLAASWGVRPGVIRQLVARPPEPAASKWTARPRELAVLLNALRPEDVPTDAAEDWDLFDEAVSIGRRLFRKPVWQSAPALQWLRDCVYHERRGGEAVRTRWLPDKEALGEINRFRDALAESLRHDAGGSTAASAQPLLLAGEVVIDRFFSRSAHRGGLGKIAADYQKSLTDLRRKLREVQARASRVALGTEMWPLIPADFVSSDGTRVVRPLITYEALTNHGTALANCLGRSYAFRYLRQGAQGTTFVLGLFDAATGSPCSTAEVVVKRYAETHSYGLIIAQHTAKENADPSPACIQAMDELLRCCREGDVRRHLEQGWRLLSARRSRRIRHHNQAEDLVTVRMALRQCLGDQTYDELLEELLQARPITPAADPTPP
jgi:hypothetical protein